MSGKLIIICAPSGAGKTTIVRHILENIPGIEFSVSATNRKQRPNEVHGVDYYFISTEEFTSKIAHDEFLEWEEVYPGTFYGTLKTEIDRIDKKNVVLRKSKVPLAGSGSTLMMYRSFLGSTLGMTCTSFLGSTQ